MNKSKRVLCVYSTRSVDSNLFMASTVFAGLQKAGYMVDMIFCGSEVASNIFRQKYARYFHNVQYIVVPTSFIERVCRRRQRLNVVYNFIREFFLNLFFRRYSLKTIGSSCNNEYDCVLSFVPTFESGRLGYDVAKRILREARLIQFWTDPLSLGGVNAIVEIPWYRFLHVMAERRLLSFADEVVFCYPLLCEMEQRLHPMFARKMSWSDVGYIEHECDDYKPQNERIRIGLFGAYQRKVRNIFPFLDAIKSFPEAQFVLRGDSDVVIHPEEYSNLDYQPGRISVNEVEKLESECDALLCLGGKSGVTHPAGKVFYYASYNKPILYIGDGVNNDYFKGYLSSFGRYLICDNSKDSIVDGLKRLISAIPDFELIIPNRLQLDTIARKIIEGTISNVR